MIVEGETLESCFDFRCCDISVAESDVDLECVVRFVLLKGEAGQGYEKELNRCED